MFDRVGAGIDREADAIGAVRVHRDLLAEHMRGLDDRPCLVIEHLLAEARTDPAVDPAGRGEFDHVGAAPDLEPHRAAAIVGAVASVARARKERPKLVRSEEHTSELQSLMRISYAVFCLKKNNKYQI